ncbi:MAG: GerAB/ArcD/ProY family transporter, partial [Clostridia bacterium]|nr:GerAB/ArcD/ProY family transporter [Clostridia bacterium]
MSKLQLYSVMSVGTLVYVYTYALNSLMLTAGTSGFISSIIGCVIWLIFITLASLFLKNHENKRLSEIVYYCLGDFFGMVVNCIIAVIIIFSMSERLFECIRLMKLYGYNYTPAFVIAAVIMLVCFYCGKAGEKAVAKTAIPVVFAILGGIIIVIISGLGQFELGNLFPVLGNGGSGILKSSIWTLSAVDNIIIGLIFADKIKSEKFLKSGVAASITALVAYTVCTLCYNLTFPYSSGQNNTSGIIDIARGAENGGFFQRFEAILLFIVIIGMICFIAIYLSAAVKQIDDTFSIKKRKSAVLSGAIAVLVGIIALIPDNTKIEDNILQWYRKYSFILLFFIGIFILIGSTVKKGFIKKVASVSMVLIILFGMTSCTDYREIENEAFAVM